MFSLAVQTNARRDQIRLVLHSEWETKKNYISCLESSTSFARVSLLGTCARLVWRQDIATALLLLKNNPGASDLTCVEEGNVDAYVFSLSVLGGFSAWFLGG